MLVISELWPKRTDGKMANEYLKIKKQGPQLSHSFFHETFLVGLSVLLGTLLLTGTTYSISFRVIHIQ